MAIHVTCPGLQVSVEAPPTVRCTVSLHQVGVLPAGRAASDGVTQHTVRRARSAELRRGVQEEAPPTVQNAVSLKDGKRRQAALTLGGAETLLTVSITRLTHVSVLVEAFGAARRADAVLQNITVHTEEAVRPQGTTTRVTAPVTLSAGSGRSVQVVLMSTAVVLTLSKLKHLCGVSARCTGSAHLTGETLMVTRLTGPMTIVMVTNGTFRSTDTQGRQNGIYRTGSTGERPRPTARLTGWMAFQTRSVLAVGSSRTLRHAVISQEPPSRLLTPHTHTANTCQQVS